MVRVMTQIIMLAVTGMAVIAADPKIVIYIATSVSVGIAHM
jgi:hypothetical protein